MRLFQVLADIALARGEWRAAVEHADKGVADCRARHRVKYEALALTARALMQLGEIGRAASDAASAVVVGRRLGDPVVLIDALHAHLQVDGTDALLAEARSAVNRVLADLPNDRLRQQLLDSQSIREILKR